MGISRCRRYILGISCILVVVEILRIDRFDKGLEKYIPICFKVFIGIF